MTTDETNIEKQYRTLTDTLIATAHTHERNGRWHNAIDLLKLGMKMVSAYKVEKACLQAQVGDFYGRWGKWQRPLLCSKKLDLWPQMPTTSTPSHRHSTTWAKPNCSLLTKLEL